jgi:hypothetical protein
MKLPDCLIRRSEARKRITPDKKPVCISGYACAMTAAGAGATASISISATRIGQRWLRFETRAQQDIGLERADIDMQAHSTRGARLVDKAETARRRIESRVDEQ